MNLGIKLLVAEDDPNMGTILKVYLTQKGYTVFHATDGQQALDLYKEGNIDACILDVMMPVKDGFTVAKELRRIDKNIPILFLTAKSLEADKLKGFEGGYHFLRYRANDGRRYGVPALMFHLAIGEGDLERFRKALQAEHFALGGAALVVYQDIVGGSPRAQGGRVGMGRHGAGYVFM